MLGKGKQADSLNVCFSLVFGRIAVLVAVAFGDGDGRPGWHVACLKQPRECSH